MPGQPPDESGVETRGNTMALSEQQVGQYFDDGFLIVEDLLTPEDLQPVMDEFEEIVDEWAEKLHRAGKIADKCANEGLFSRMTRLERQWPGAAALVHNREQVRPALAALWSSDKLLDVVEQFLGPDICGHPISVIRTKTPDNALMTVPWHQDAAYFSPGAEGTLQPVAWIPFLDTNLENGTLQVIRGGHRSGRLFRHRPERDVAHPKSWYVYIDEADLPEGERVTCALEFGSVLFHNTMMPHRSTENHSDRVRWTVDLRWQRPGEPTGFDERPLVPMRKAGDPGYRLDWPSWQAGTLGDIQAYRGLSGDGFEYSCTGPWLDRWAEAA